MAARPGRRFLFTALHKMEKHMNGHLPVALQSQPARLEYFALIGNLISNGIATLWSDAKKLAAWIPATLRARIESPDQPTTLPPVYF